MKFNIHLRCALIGSLGVFSGHAQTYDQVAPRTPEVSSPAPALPVPAPAPAAENDSRLLADSLRGLVFVSTRDDLQPSGRSDAGILVSGIPLLETPTFREQFQSHLGQPLTLGLVRRITREVILYLRTHDRPVVDVIVPEQNISTGTLQFLIIESRLGAIRVEGNHWFSTERIAGAVRARPGEVIAGTQLMRDVGWLNQNPFRQIDLVFARGGEAGQTDIILRTTDRRPWRVYTGYENSGNALTDEDRVLFGANWGDAFGWDQQLNYQLTASPDFEQMVAHSGSYLIPLPWRHTLTIFGSYAQSRPELADALFTLKGVAWQVSARYQLPLPSWHRISHNFSAGFDFKRSNNDLGFGGTQVFAQSTDVVQLILNYSGNLEDQHGATSADLTLAMSPGGMTDRNATAKFAATRALAQADYSYARLTLLRTTKLPQGFSWLIRSTLQTSTTNLLGSEQLGFGGSASLRGYEEREVNGDGGAILVNELHTPHRPLGKGQWQALTFLDLGLATIHDPQPGEDDRTELASIGLGLRYRLGAHFTLRADYGWQLKAGVSAHRSSRAHIGATLAY